MGRKDKCRLSGQCFAGRPDSVAEVLVIMVFARGYQVSGAPQGFTHLEALEAVLFFAQGKAPWPGDLGIELRQVRQLILPLSMLPHCVRRAGSHPGNFSPLFIISPSSRRIPWKDAALIVLFRSYFRLRKLPSEWY